MPVTICEITDIIAHVLAVPVWLENKIRHLAKKAGCLDSQGSRRRTKVHKARRFPGIKRPRTIVPEQFRIPKVKMTSKAAKTAAGYIDRNIEEDGRRGGNGMFTNPRPTRFERDFLVWRAVSAKTGQLARSHYCGNCGAKPGDGHSGCGGCHWKWLREARGLANPAPLVETWPVLKRPLQPVAEVLRARTANHRPTGLFDVRVDGENIYVQKPGGITRTLPKAGHTKYWYFLRKRGTWNVSTHHPYGDE